MNLSNPVSPYEVSVLFDGYAYVEKKTNVSKANCSCTLIRGTKNVLVDTMTAWDGNKLKASLIQKSLHPKDIHYVVCTHGHSDHIGCNYLFSEAIHIVGRDISKKDVYFEHDFNESPYKIDDYIKVIATPGHTMQDVSVLVDSSIGMIAIVGDLFEREPDGDDHHESIACDDPQAQSKNQQMILDMADYVVPGHGPMFKVKD